MRLSSFLVLLLLLMINSTATSQELFNVKYTGMDGVKYNCLLMDDSTGGMNVRIWFDKKKIHYLADLRYEKPTADSVKGKEFIYFKADSGFKNKYGLSNSFLTRQALAGFVPPVFVYYTNASIGEKPDLPYVTSDSKKFVNQKKVDVCEQISMEAVAMDRLKPYFIDGDTAHRDLKIICARNAPSEGDLPPSDKIFTLHFIMVANTSDRGVGPACARDKDNIEKELKAITKTLNIDYKPYFIGGENFSKTNLLSKLNEVNPSKDDIVIFFYSGHGSRWEGQQDPYPNMNLWITRPFSLNPKTGAEVDSIRKIVQDYSIGFSKVVEIIKKKPARLNIVLGDLCNSDLGVPRPLSTKIPFTFGQALRNSTPVLIRNPAKLRQLFLSAGGNLLSAAAKPTETAAGSNTTGGYFATSFVEALRDAGNNKITASWDKIIAQTISNALLLRKNFFPTEVQNGLWYFEPAK